MSAKRKKSHATGGHPITDSATERDATGFVLRSVKRLRAVLPIEKRIKVLMLAVEQLERTGFKKNAGLVRKRLAELCAAENTAVTIRFEMHGQDFSEWDLNREGCVIDCRPFQAFQWVGTFVMNYENLTVGGPVIIFTHNVGKLTMNYPVESLRPGPAAGPIKYPPHKPDNLTLHARTTEREHNKYPKGRNG